ncbi:MAG: CheR family methyltransferase [Candidatus Woesearchaeota archaeon]
MFSSPEEFRSYVKLYYGEGTWLKFVRDLRRPLVGISLERLVQEFHCQGLDHRTSFFSKEITRVFDKYLLPLFQENNSKGNPTKILSLPCSSGQEVYSLATLAWDQGFRDFAVEGRDLCDHLVKRAKKREYWAEQAKKDLLEPFLEKKYFRIQKRKRKRDRSPNLIISPDIVERCNFEQQDILLEEVPSGYNAIFCLNLLMHLNQKGKELALSNLADNLCPGDLLFLGDSYQVNRGYVWRGGNLQRDRMTDYNQFVGELEKRSEGKFRKIGESNVYRRV